MNCELRSKNSKARSCVAGVSALRHSISQRPVSAFILRNSQFQIPRAFTLVELMVVVAILSVLATIVTVSVTDYLTKGKQAAARTEIAQIASALQLFFTESDRYPDNDEGLALLSKPSPAHAHGILQGDLLDPWGKPYVYVHPGLHGAFDLCSYGANGQEGGTGTDSDLCNWTP